MNPGCTQESETRVPVYLSPSRGVPRGQVTVGGGQDTVSRTGSSVGCADYDPDLIVDNISFARTGLTASLASTTPSDSGARDLREPAGGVHAILTGGLEPDVSRTTGLGGDEVDDVPDETAAREEQEERGFMRALGLEFDEIARRATSN